MCYFCRCVITELFTEGSSAFDLSQLLEYRNKVYSPWKVLEKIEDTDIRVSFSNFDDLNVSNFQ